MDRRRLLAILGSIVGLVVVVALAWNDPAPGRDGTARSAGTALDSAPTSTSSTAATGPGRTTTTTSREARRTTTTGRGARSTARPSDGRSVALSRLPNEAADTWALVESDGPFPFDRDGVVFGNFEGHLPRRARGYYREYTVVTPGLDHRGARRLVVGEDGDVWYTDDHYETFQPVDTER